MAEISRTYDDHGRPQLVDLGKFEMEYGYDAYGRFAAVTSIVRGIFTRRTGCLYSYVEDSGLLASIKSGRMLLTTFSYEPHRDVRVEIAHTWDTTNPISHFAYTYDAAGRRTVRVDSNAITNEFGYNLRSELISAIMGTNTYGYSYDAIGNRMAYTNNAGAITYVANELNQYTNISPSVGQPLYDLDGNMTYDGTWNYAWDAENRLVAMNPAATNPGSVRLRFVYDYMSRRVEKEVESWTGSAWSNVVTIQFTYDGWNMVSEKRSDESRPNYYVWGLDLSGTLQGAGGVGALLARVRQENIPHPLYYAHDANGNITDVLNNDGTFAARYEYDPYGNLVAQSGDQADENPFRFSSKYCDDETGLYYYGYRYYSPELGRFLNRDPVEELGGINYYIFSGNRPIDLVDKFGLIASGLITWNKGFNVSINAKTEDKCCPDGNKVTDISHNVTIEIYIGASGSPWQFYFTQSAGGWQVEAGAWGGIQIFGTLNGAASGILKTDKCNGVDDLEGSVCVSVSGNLGVNVGGAASITLRHWLIDDWVDVFTFGVGVYGTGELYANATRCYTKDGWGDTQFEWGGSISATVLAGPFTYTHTF